MVKTQSRRPAEPLDFSNCDREPIHILGNVQAFGCLIAVSTDWIINHASRNTAESLGLDADSIIGTRFSDHFPEETAHKLRGKTQTLGNSEAVTRVFGFELFEDGRHFDISIHMFGRGYTFEFEAKPDGAQRDDLSLVQPLVARVRAHKDITGLTNEAARALRALTGFDRVMIYQFAGDGTGTVIAEACEHSLDRYLGLRYPASDIPRQARELYKRSHLRLIADVDAEVHPIVPSKSPEGEPLDLSLAVTRAVSPTHLQYLRNMGVAASMSVSILRRGELWGLFACHHRTPRYIDYEKRTAVELFAQLFAYELAEKINEAEVAEAAEARILHDRLMARVSSGRSLYQDFEAVAEEIWEVISFDGIALFSENQYLSLGSAPTEAEFLPLVRFLNTTAVSTVFSTDHLSARYEKAHQIADRVAGLLVLPISRTPRDYIVLFRREIAQIVKWAGNPEKPVERDGEGLRLSPRKSFEAWREVVKGRSTPWTSSELKAANALRVTLLEVVLKVTDVANQERRRAQQKQELLIAELNHRVRNILNLIRGIVSQGRSETKTIEEFTEVLDGRIQSLARAHDQLTQRDWAPASFRSLISIETGAYVGGNRDRVWVIGEDVLLSPEAFSTMALVIHELVTNSMKYGSLSRAEGHVEIGIAKDLNGALLLKWREKDGPPVQAPERRGFGTTIIENSVPFELRGAAEIRYRVTGLEVDLTIPSMFYESGVETGATLPPAADIPASGSPLLTSAVLVLEDNLIIAMDAQDKLAALGAETVHTASAVADALELLESEEIGFAMLDVNLGQETSAKVAHRLAHLKIPFVLATGYGSLKDLKDTYPPVPILKKPYMTDNLRLAIEETMAAAGSAPAEQSPD